MVIFFVICHQPHHTWINPQLLETFLFIPHLREPGEICTYTPSSTKTPGEPLGRANVGSRGAGPTRHEFSPDPQNLEKVKDGFSVWFFGGFSHTQTSGGEGRVFGCLPSFGDPIKKEVKHLHEKMEQETTTMNESMYVLFQKKSWFSSERSR